MSEQQFSQKSKVNRLVQSLTLLWLDSCCFGYFVVHECSLPLSVDHLESTQCFTGVLEVEGAEQTVASELLPAPLGFSRFLVSPNPVGALQPGTLLSSCLPTCSQGFCSLWDGRTRLCVRGLAVAVGQQGFLKSVFFPNCRVPFQSGFCIPRSGA